jgi:hypothetical protein
MKKLVMTMVLMVMLLSSFSQVRIGYTESELKQEFEDNGFYRLYDENEEKYLISTFKKALVIYYFTGDISTTVSVLPTNLAEYNFYRRHYDQLYVRVSKNKWKAVLNDKAFVIELRKDNNGRKYFYWRENMEPEEKVNK